MKKLCASKVISKATYAVLIALLCALINVAQAKVEVVQFDDPSQQTLYKRLIDELRCLVCQNQNLADSNADLAIDLRKKVRVLINDGKTYDDVVEFMVSRYGEFVMYRPPFNRSTIFLWLSPAVLLISVFSIVIWRKRSSSRASTIGSEFDKEHHEKVRALLQAQDD